MQEERKGEKATGQSVLLKEIENGEECHDRFIGIAWLRLS